MATKMLGDVEPGDRVLRSSNGDVHTVECVYTSLQPFGFRQRVIVCDRGMTLSGSTTVPVSLAE